MAKQQTTKPVKQGFSIPERWRDALALGALTLTIIIFFAKALFTKLGFFASDYVAGQSFSPLFAEARKQGESMLWMPNIFGGMPILGGNSGARAYDFLSGLISTIAYGIWPSLFVNSSTSTTVILWYIIIAIGTYFLVRKLTGNRTASFVASFATVFSTWVIVLAMIGHATKPQALSAVPFIFLSLLELLKSRSWRHHIIWFSVLALACAHLLGSSHMQFIFYFFFAVGIFFVFELVHALRAKNFIPFARAAGLFVLAVGLAFAVHAEQYLATAEYTPYSIRGSGPAELPPATKGAERAPDPSGGLDYEYATNWSFSPQEVITFFIPDFYGFGNITYKGPLTGGREQRIGTYFGQMPFTDAAYYMGITIMVLALVGIIGAWRERFVKFLVVLSALALIISFGKNFPLLYDLMFYYVPAFNKFRAPSMILVLVQWSMPLLAAFGVRELFNQVREGTSRERWITFGKRGAIISGGMLVIIVIAQSPLRSWYEGLIAAGRSVKDLPQSLYGIIYDNFFGDAVAACLFAGATFMVIWFAARRIISLRMVMIILPVLVGIDLIRVAVRPMELTPDGMKNAFAERDYMKYLRSDTTHFRIIDHVLESPNMSAYYGFYTAEGYHPAKLRVYQDMLDATSGGSTSQLGSPFMWNLLDVKYYIDRKPIADSTYGIFPVFRGRDGYVMRNEHVLPHAFFVAQTEVAKPVDILHHLRDADFNPRDVAFIEQPLPEPLERAQATAHAEITSFTHDAFTLTATATGNNFLVVSEIYYPAGWKAFIDGTQTPIVKTDYLLRGIVVPAGTHTIEFRFEPGSFVRGKIITLLANSLLAALLIVGIVFARAEKKRST